MIYSANHKRETVCAHIIQFCSACDINFFLCEFRSLKHFSDTAILSFTLVKRQIQTSAISECLKTNPKTHSSQIRVFHSPSYRQCIHFSGPSNIRYVVSNSEKNAPTYPPYKICTRHLPPTFFRTPVFATYAPFVGKSAGNTTRNISTKHQNTTNYVTS